MLRQQPPPSRCPLFTEKSQQSQFFGGGVQQPIFDEIFPPCAFFKEVGSSKANFVLANFEEKIKEKKEFCECTRQDKKQDGDSDNEGNDDDDDSDDCYVGDIGDVGDDDVM